MAALGLSRRAIRLARGVPDLGGAAHRNRAAPEPAADPARAAASPANVLNRLPKSPQSKAKRALQDIWMAETKIDANAAFDAFVETYAIKYDKAVGCLTKDREALLAFYDFPAEHWKHLRTTNPIESTFATVGHRTVRSPLKQDGDLAKAAEKCWRRLDGHSQLPS